MKPVSKACVILKNSLYKNRKKNPLFLRRETNKQYEESVQWRHA
jgi:hypothetical protein